MKWIFLRIPRRGQTGQPRGETATILAELLRGGRGRGRDDDIHGSVVGRHGSHRHLHRCLLALRDALGGRHQDGRRVFLARSVGPRHRLLHNRPSGSGGEIAIAANMESIPEERVRFSCATRNFF